MQDFETGRATVATACGPVSYVSVGDGPAAVFVHGVGTNAWLWRKAVAALADRRRCIALDLPLHGQTPVRHQDLSLPGLADVVEAACEALELDRFDLVANDTGGAVAQVVAARRPGRLRSLVLTNCDVHDNLPPPAFRSTVRLARSGLFARLAPLLLRDPAKARRRVFGSTYEDVTTLPEDVVRRYLDPVVGTRDRAKQFARLLTSLRAEDLVAVEPELARLRVPTLVVWGTGDIFFDVRWAYWLAEHIPGVTRVVELDGARLFFPDERATEFAALVGEHWAQVDAGVSGSSA
jgi:pimeloyl-ACP methyl ester carboxylesterase